jgi:hypothetical protein
VLKVAASVVPVMALALALAACGSLPEIGGAPLVRPSRERAAMDLAAIPNAPPVSSAETNDALIQALTRDRARTEEAAEVARRQPVALPEPAPPFPPGF